MEEKEEDQIRIGRRVKEERMDEDRETEKEDEEEEERKDEDREMEYVLKAHRGGGERGSGRGATGEVERLSFVKPMIAGAMIQPTQAGGGTGGRKGR